MRILTIRTDKPQVEIGLFDNDRQLAYKKWQADRQLAETIHKQIQNLLASQGVTLREVGGIICFEGPGSFTGLRIGLSVANALAYSLGVSIVGAGGDAWIKAGAKKLMAGKDQKIILPKYGAPVRITKPRK